MEAFVPTVAALQRGALTRLQKYGVNLSDYLLVV